MKNTKNYNAMDLDAMASDIADVTTAKYENIPWNYAFDKVLSFMEIEMDEITNNSADEIAEWIKDDWEYDLMSEDKLMERCSSDPLA